MSEYKLEILSSVLYIIVLLISLYRIRVKYKTVNLYDYGLKKIKNRFKVWDFLFLIIISLVYFITGQYFFLYYMLFFWVLFLIDIIEHFYLKKKKPTVIYIKGNFVFFTEKIYKPKEVNDFDTIFYDRFSKKIILRFNGKDIELYLREYDLDNFKSFLKILISKSGNDITYPPELQKIFNKK